MLNARVLALSTILALHHPSAWYTITRLTALAHLDSLETRSLAVKRVSEFISYCKADFLFLWHQKSIFIFSPQI
jgi:hypothetical protein